MKTRLFYMIEDDWNSSTIYEDKDSWLESLRYNLDESLEETEEEYYQDAEEEANKLYDDMANGTKTNSDWVNGWWYSHSKVDVFYQDENIMLISHYHQTGCKDVVSIYFADDDTYSTDMNEGVCITENDEDIEIEDTLKQYINKTNVNYQAIIKDLRNYWGGC